MAKDTAAPTPRETPTEQPALHRGRADPHPNSEDDRVRKVRAGGPPSEKRHAALTPPKRGRATTTPKSKATKGAK